ncbi:MAG: HAMP domain-containing sensor histidine kinase [Desulfuromonadales bacterium]
MKTQNSIIHDRLAGRATAAEIASSYRKVAADRRITDLIDAITDFLLILNAKHQIVAVNRSTLNALSMDSPENLLGRRPGEAFSCVNSEEGEDGCGTGIHCTTCGAVLSFLAAREKGKPHTEECRLTFGPKETALDLEVVTTPLVIEDENFYVCALKDISARKRREVLEKVFFHDVINTAGGIHGLASLLVEHELPMDQDRQYRQWMHQLTAKMIEEIKQQAQLLAAERNEFTPDLNSFSLTELLEDIQALYANHETAAGKYLRVEGIREGVIWSDEGLVRRILGNLIKNAMEATTPGTTVTLGVHDIGEEILFSVKNPEVMPEEVRLQIFKRSFTTKPGEGRGVGTYSVKLFGEKYLRGKVDFSSRAPEGTIFTFALPKGCRSRR